MAHPIVPKLKFPWRATIYGIGILYLALDLYLIRGPVRKMIDRMSGKGIEEQVAQVPTGLICTVNATPITVSELDRAVWEYCEVRGLEVDEVHAERMEVIRSIVLDRLINDLALWHYSRLNPVDYSEAAVDVAIAEVRGHFTSDESFAERLEAQGMSAGRFREYMENQVHQRAWLEAKAAKMISVSDEEVDKWFAENSRGLQIPERWRARQIFMATLDKDVDEVGQKIRDVAAALAAGEVDFEGAVKAHSQDERSKKAGGDLNYFTASRMPEDFVVAVAKQKVGEVGEPFQTELGWHLVEVTDHKPARAGEIGELREEVRAFLSNLKREDVIDQIMVDLRKRAKIWPAKPTPSPVTGK